MLLANVGEGESPALKKNYSFFGLPQKIIQLTSN